ncbi:MAG: DUF4956 domain-containing protein [Burkholderiales bacterium]|nr:DUF4956 domain-containing protein [Burkholderiales bacterium]
MNAFLEYFPVDVRIRLGIDLAAMLLLVFGLYYRRYRDKELVTAAALFNVFIFAVLTVLSKVEFGIAAGFGLFAILAMFTLRSEPIGKTEITYFFGSVAIAVICSVQGTAPAFAAGVAALVVLGAWAIDHPRVLRSVEGVRITLDQIDRHALSDPVAMRAQLSQRLGVQVMSYQITALDYVNDMARINVHYRKGLDDDHALAHDSVSPHRA